MPLAAAQNACQRLETRCQDSFPATTLGVEPLDIEPLAYRPSCRAPCVMACRFVQQGVVCVLSLLAVALLCWRPVADVAPLEAALERAERAARAARAEAAAARAAVAQAPESQEPKAGAGKAS